MYKTIIAIMISGAVLAACTNETPTTENQTPAAENPKATSENLMHADTDRYKALAEAPFVNDYPTPEATRTLDEELYFQRAVQTYLWALPAVNMHAMKEGQAKYVRRRLQRGGHL